MIHAGTNEIDGVSVEVVRKRCRRINLRVDSEGGVHLTVPKWWATLREGETFLKSKWNWILKTRAKVLARPTVVHAPMTDAGIESLRTLLTELNDLWSARVGEPNVTWKIRRVKSIWGCCHWRSRYITYNAELAHAPRELVEYVVVHEFTHFAVHGHGPKFYALMDKRLPGWQILRKRLNKRDWDSLAQTASEKPNVALVTHGEPTPVPAAPCVPAASVRPCERTFVQDALPGF